MEKTCPKPSIGGRVTNGADLITPTEGNDSIFSSGGNDEAWWRRPPTWDRRRAASTRLLLDPPRPVVVIGLAIRVGGYAQGETLVNIENSQRLME